MVEIAAHYQRSFENLRTDGFARAARRQLNDFVDLIDSTLLDQCVLRITQCLDSIIALKNDPEQLDKLAANLYLAMTLNQQEIDINQKRVNEAARTSPIGRLASRDLEALESLDKLLWQTNIRVATALDPRESMSEANAQNYQSNILNSLNRFDRFLIDADFSDFERAYSLFFPTNSNSDDHIDKHLLSHDEKLDRIRDRYLKSMEAITNSREPVLLDYLSSWQERQYYRSKNDKANALAQVKAFARMAKKLQGIRSIEKYRFLELMKRVDENLSRDENYFQVASGLAVICPSKSKGFLSNEFLNEKAIDAILHCQNDQLVELIHNLAVIEEALSTKSMDDLDLEDIEAFFTDINGYGIDPDQYHYAFSSIVVNSHSFGR